MIREVFRDRWLLIVDKPSGLPTQPDRGRQGDDLHTLLRATYGDVALHHRLDRPASGLVLTALHPSVHKALTQAFRDHTVHRTYLAVLAGDRMAPGDEATWDEPVDGKPARTTAHILGGGSGLLASRLVPATGRMHQLRRHAAMHGMPLVGDRRYGGHAADWWPRLALHATTLDFRHPATGAAVHCHSPLPHDLRDLWKRAGGPDTDEAS